MILAALADYYERVQASAARDNNAELVAGLGFSIQKITFCVVLHPDGRLAAIEDARVPDPNDRKGSRNVPRMLVVPGGAKPSGSALNPCFLWDNSGYLLGYKAIDPKPERTREAFEAFRERHLKLKDEIDDAEYGAVCAFLKSWEPEQAKDHAELSTLGTGFGVFRIRGQTHFVHERPTVRRYWLKQIHERDENSTRTGQCLVTGKNGSLARIHEPRIKGVLNAQSSGATLVSFNFDATESYGKEQSYNAPVGEETAFRYANGLNHLLRMGSRQRVQIGDATAVFWTAQSSPVEAVFGVVFQPAPQDETQKREVEAVLRQIARAAYPRDLGDPATPFYLLGLSPNAARLSVRFWHVSSVGNMVTTLRRHYADLALDGRAPWEPEFPSVQDVLDQTARERKDIPPLLAGGLMRAILDNTNYPDALYLAILRRLRADRRVGHVRIAMLKAHLNRNHAKEVPVSLDVNRPEAAYHLGRLFAALEKVQEDAFTNEAGRVTINDTIRDRYFGAASATPRTVFPRLVRLKQHHLGKLANVGQRINHEKLIQEIVAKFDGFPAHLNLQDQGLFAIGYYHQRKDLFTKKDKVLSAQQEN